MNSSTTRDLGTSDGRLLGAARLRRGAQPQTLDERSIGFAGGAASRMAVALQRETPEAHPRLQEARARALSDSAIEAAAILDARGVVRYLSSNAVRVLGADPGAMRGAALIAFVHPDDRSKVRRTLLRSASRPGSPHRLSFRLRGKSGHWRELRGTATNRLAERGVRGIVVNLTDITAIRRSERALQARTETLELKAVEQGEFVHTVAHALKNPLASIVAMAEVLDESAGGPGSDLKQGLSLIQRNATRMHTLVKDLLALARADAGLDDLPMTPVSLDSVLETVRHELSHQLASRDVVVAVEAPLPSVVANSSRLAELLSNLIDNAVKYTPADRQPEIEIGAAQIDGRVECWVTDNGIGIVPEARDEAFELFHRLDNARGLRQAGSGVGLAVAKRIVERHGGRIWIEDGRRGGASFHFTLRADRLETPTAGRVAARLVSVAG